MPIAADRHNAQRLELGPWRIDLERGTVIADGEQGKLLPRAESLLLLLCRHANQVVGREQILDNVWAGRVVEDAAISHCVWQIRKAFGDQGKDILQTLPKRGYLLTIADDAWLIEDQAATQSLDNDSLSREAFRSQETRNAASPIAGAAAPLSHSPRLRPQAWRIAAMGIAVAMVMLIGFLVWQTQRAAPARIVLQPKSEMTVAMIAPGALNWLRQPVLRTAVESAYLRDGAVTAFDRPQRSNPFAGPHLQVEVAPGAGREIVAELSLHYGSSVVRERFRGPGNALARAVHDLLERSLAPTAKKPTPAEDALISALTADLLFDRQRALVEFRRALARDPASAAVTIPMAVSLYDQGKGREALALVERIRPDAALSDAQRCDMQTLLVQLAPDTLMQPMCARAGRLLQVKRLEMREVLRATDADQDRPKGAQQWLFDEIVTIRAHIRLDELDEAEDRIIAAQGVAAKAGWEHARLEFEALRVICAMHRGRVEAGVRMGIANADAIAAIGDEHWSIERRTYALRLMQVAPGNATTERRKLLQGIVDRARAIGSLRGEIAALHLLAPLDRDRTPQWRAHMGRIRELIESAYTPVMALPEKQVLLNELRFGLQYRETLDGIAVLERHGATQAQAQLWNMTLRVESHFARDELPSALTTLDAMERENFNLMDSNPCLFAWLFAEAGRADRARLILKPCLAIRYDRAAQATRGDFGMLGEARLYQLGGESERAWPIVRARIDALSATPELTRQEAESLALLARYATAMPGADRQRLQRALGIVEQIAARDGAGPTLRTGVHLLRWRLCATDGRDDCGPVLPPWAPEELFEQRLAREAAGR
jgi:DNA-binding winged helix-turn-helix (wHTH) protein